MFTKVFVLLALASLACAGYLTGYSSNSDVSYANSKTQSYWPSGSGANGGGAPSLGLNGWNNYNTYNNGRFIVADSNQLNKNYNNNKGRYSNVNGWVGNYGVGYGGATSSANSNLQSYGSYGYGRYGNGKYNGNGDYYNSNSYSYPRYGFSYGVNDLQTGDQKYQQEQRDGDRVWGSYGLRESDGTTRNVRYVADDKNGFNAVVTRTGLANHPY